MRIRHKKWIAVLLFLSCLASATLLINPVPSPKKLYSAVMLDSLIKETFREFQIDEQKVRDRIVKADSVFSRKVYTAKLPGYVSKTDLHIDLHKKMLPYNVQAPARISLPENEMRIHLVYNHTVIRTLILQNDDRSNLNLIADPN